VRNRKNDVYVVDGKQFLTASGEPLVAGVGLALGAVPGAAGNGDLTITCLMGSNF